MKALAGLYSIFTLVALWGYLPLAQADPQNRKETVPLLSAPDTPDLPPYPSGDATLLRAYKATYRKNNTVSLEIILRARQRRRQVIDWYRSTMQQYGWTITDNGGDDSLVASRLDDGHLCMVQVNDDESGVGSTINLTYRIFKPYMSAINIVKDEAVPQ